MGYKYIGDANVGVSFNVNTPTPLDIRTVVDSIQELYQIPEQTAYQGMTVANIADGNIYMLVDKSKIKEKAGWKASYESIQIIACTESEYKIWQNNTTEQFTPINESESFIHPNTYYYIYEDSIEDSKENYYLRYSWGVGIEEELKKKANSSEIESLVNTLADTKNQFNNYQLKDEYEKDKSEINNSIEELSNNINDNYYTKTDIDNDFVTKESLRGSLEGDSDDFVFVTQTQYNSDQELIQKELNKTLKTDEDGQLSSVIVGEIKSPTEEGKEQLSIQVTSDGLSIKGDMLAKISEIPVIETITEEEYNTKLEEGGLDENAYYYIYNNSDENLSYVTKKYVDDLTKNLTALVNEIHPNYVNKVDFRSQLDTIGQYIETLQNKITELEETIDLIRNTYLENSNDSNLELT